MTAPLLLDTCAVLYLVSGAPMARAALEVIDQCSDIGQPLNVSPITAWEIGMLTTKGRLKLSLTPQRWFERLMATDGIELCDLTPNVLIASSFLPGDLHRDPAERIIVASAREYGYTVLTRDGALLDYADHGHLSAIAC